MAIDDNAVHELIHLRDQTVTTEAGNSVSRLIGLGKDSAMDLLLYPRFDGMGNIGASESFSQFVGCGVIYAVNLV